MDYCHAPSVTEGRHQGQRIHRAKRVWGFSCRRIWTSSLPRAARGTRRNRMVKVRWLSIVGMVGTRTTCGGDRAGEMVQRCPRSPSVGIGVIRISGHDGFWEARCKRRRSKEGRKENVKCRSSGVRMELSNCGFQAGGQRQLYTRSERGITIHYQIDFRSDSIFNLHHAPSMHSSACWLPADIKASGSVAPTPRLSLQRSCMRRSK